MPNSKYHKKGGSKQSKQLLKLLRALALDGALLIKNIVSDGREEFTVCVGHEDRTSVIFRPDKAIADECIKADFLQLIDNGWQLAANGRFALKRLLAAGAQPYAQQHQERSYRRRKVNGANKTVLVNDKATPLGWLYRRKDKNGQSLVSKTQFDAGERLSRDFQFAGLVQSTTSNWSDVPNGSGKGKAPSMGAQMSDNTLAARQRVQLALREVGGDLGNILLDICCFQIGLAQAEKARGWPQRSGKIILQIALDHLAEHYGMTKKLHPFNASPPVSHWGADNYRPTINGAG